MEIKEWQKLGYQMNLDFTNDTRQRRAAALTDSTGLDPNIHWSKTGRIQLNEEVTVTLTLDMDIGLFGGFGSFPITLRSEATGKSEVYWK